MAWDAKKVEDFAKRNAGRMVEWLPSGHKTKVKGVVVGYGKGGAFSHLNLAIIVTGNPIGVSKYRGRDFGGYGVCTVPDLAKFSEDYAWLDPEKVTLIGGDSDTDKFLSNFFGTPKPAFKKKEIPAYPHTCPKCKGPAYIGFNTTVDCEAKCGFKVE